MLNARSSMLASLVVTVCVLSGCGNSLSSSANRQAEAESSAVASSSASSSAASSASSSAASSAASVVAPTVPRVQWTLAGHQMNLTLRPGSASGPVSTYEVRVATAGAGPDAGRVSDTCPANGAEAVTCALAPLKRGDWEVWVRAVGADPDQVTPWYRGAFGNVSSCTQADGLSGACEKFDKGPGGGLVVYDAGSRQPWGQFLEAAPAGWSGESRDAVKQWCVPRQPGYNVELDAPVDVGAGAANTALIIENCGDDTAAVKAAAYRGAGLADWFLPSKDELTAVYSMRTEVGDLTCGDYWSSSQVPSTAELSGREAYAWRQRSDYGLGPKVTIKSSFRCVRPVRAF